MNNNISQNICVQLLIGQPEIGNKASFYTLKRWNPNTSKNIYITFIEDPQLLFPVKSIYDLQQGDPSIILDPLQYKFSNSILPIDIKSAIQEIVAERIQPYISMNLIFVPYGDYSDVRISFDSTKGSYSYIGTDCQQIPQSSETMNFAWFDVGTVIHEFGHVLGLIHEHQTTLANPIIWNTQALYAWALEYSGWNQQQVQDQIIYRYSQSSINGSNFDPDSIMLYFFPASVTLNNTGTKQNYILSPLDVIYINQQYPLSSSQNCANRLCLNPQEFYIYAYNTPISQYPTPTIQPGNSQNNFYLISGIAIIYIIILFFSILF